MQPDNASAVMMAMIGNRNARATRTGAIPHNETAPVLHRLWLTNRVECVPDAVQHLFVMHRRAGSVPRTVFVTAPALQRTVPQVLHHRASKTRVHALMAP